MIAGDWNWASLASLVGTALGPYQGDGDRIRLDVRDLQLNPDFALTLALGLNELITLAKYCRRFSEGTFVVCVFNNRDLNMVTWEQRVLAGDPKYPPSQTIPDVPYARLAELLGLTGVRVERPEDLGPALDAAFAEGGPVVVDAVVDPEIPPLPPHVSLEQTANIVGGVCWRLDEIEAVCGAARGLGLACHMDGARLFNAVVATGAPARAFAAPFDSVWVDLTKGLGAPVGAVLAGSRGFVAEAWRFKQRFGGAMRQAGIIAAAGLYALEHHIERLADDHERARRLARGLAELPGVAVDADRVETNIVIFDVSTAGVTAEAFAERAQARGGVRFSVIGPATVRAVTHLDLPPDAVERALAAAHAALVP